MTASDFARLSGRIEKLRSVLAYIVNQPIGNTETPSVGEYEAWIMWARRFAKSSIEADVNIEGRNG